MSSLARERLIQCLDLAAVGYIMAIYTLDQGSIRATLAFILHWEMVWAFSFQAPRLRQIGRRNIFICIFVNQISAVLIHLFGGEPSKGVDGYLHGSIITGFIGALPPTKLHLITLDITLLLLEVLVFSSACDPEYLRPTSSVDILTPSPTLAQLHQVASDEVDVTRVVKDNFILAQDATTEPAPNTNPVGASPSSSRSSSPPSPAPRNALQTYLESIV